MTIVNVPHPKTRTEAWSSWEAALLEMQYGVRTPPVPGVHKKFWAKYYRPSGLWLYGYDTRPSRTEVLLETLAGKMVWVNIQVGAKYNTNQGSPHRLYRIHPDFPAERERQRVYIERGWDPSIPEIISGVEDIHLIPEILTGRLTNNCCWRKPTFNVIGSKEEVPLTEFFERAEALRYVGNSTGLKVYVLKFGDKYLFAKTKRGVFLKFLDARGASTI